jgi:thymidylate kinase
MKDSAPPRFIVLEGVDGSGKTALFKLLASYYGQFFSSLPLYADRFPGSQLGTLGEWVYRFHRNRVTRAPSTAKVALPALQLLHVAAHVDTIISRIAPTLQAGGNVVLDRCWWTTYAYSRSVLSKEQAESLVVAERMFWDPLTRPVVIFVNRKTNLKPYQLTPERHKMLDGFYREIIEQQRAEGVALHEIANDGPLEETWEHLLHALGLPFIEMERIANNL